MAQPRRSCTMRDMWWFVLLLFMTACADARGEAPPCALCHADAVTALAHTPHGGDMACVACHRDAEVHAAAPREPGEMLTFRPGTGQQADAACSGCHQRETHPDGVHRRAGLACHDCHRVHGEATPPAPLPGHESMDAASASCQTCHQDVLSRFAMNERHRLAPGGVGCTDCHNPHGPSTRRFLGGGSDTCLTCHADLAGPFVFEHAAGRVEGCLACHDPHGGPNRRMLTHQREGELCYSCHVVMPGFHFGFAPTGPPRFGLDTVCTNCHSTIHGSNLDKDFLR
jgi:DmsE family decaheme c-type cytochrome